MSYHLGVDLGTAYTSAAVCRGGQAEIVHLGVRAPAVPSVVLLRDDGTFLTGETAERRAVTEPLRVAREFKRRMGDPTPMIVGDRPYPADALMARLLRSVVDTVAEREGGPAGSITVAHPANWGPFKIEILRQVITLAGLRKVDVSTVPEPEAAAIHYASQERVEVGAVVAVYDLGGGTFDAAVLRRTIGGWEVLGTPEGIEHLGGIDFDEAVFQHVRAAIGDAFDQLDPEDRAAMTAVARLRRDCVAAKEALSSDVVVTIPVLLPHHQTEVPLVRRDLEDMIRPTLLDSVDALRRALRSAEVSPDEVSAVLLVGGSSRVPLVAELVGSELRRPVAVDAHPKHAVALGAAIVAAERSTGSLPGTHAVPSFEAAERVPVAATTAPAGWDGSRPPMSATTAPAGWGGPGAAVANGSGAPGAPAAVGPAAGRPAVALLAPPAPPDRRVAAGIGNEPTVARPRRAVPGQEMVAAAPPWASRAPAALGRPEGREGGRRGPSGHRRRVWWSGAVVLALVVAVLGVLVVVRPNAGDVSVDGSPARSSSSVPSSVPAPVPAPVPSSVPAPAPSSVPSSVPSSAPAPVSSSVSVLAAQEGWTDTEVDVTAGDELRITATGEIVDDVNDHPDRTFPPDGVPDLRGEHTGDPFRDINHAALIGRIGDDGEVFAVGTDLQTTVSRSGRLQLALNDSRFDDNRGTFEAEISVTAERS